jgi:hypothetical protein
MKTLPVIFYAVGNWSRHGTCNFSCAGGLFAEIGRADFATYLSDETVTVHLHNALVKFNLHSRAKLRRCSDCFPFPKIVEKALTGGQ